MVARWAVVLWIVAAATAVQAAVPEAMNVQGVLRNAGGQTVDGAYTLTFSLYEQQAGGAFVWSEAIANVGVKNGLFSVILGNQEPLLPSLFEGKDSLWLGIQVEADTELPRERLVSQAFAFEAAHALSADTADTAATATSAGGLDCSACIDGVHIVDGSISGAELADGAVTGGKIAAGAVTSDKIAAGAVTGAQIAAGAVTGAHIADGSVTKDDLAFKPAYGNDAGDATGLDCVGCVSMNELDFAAVTQADLATAIAAIDIPAVTLESVGCADGEVPQYQAGAWGCAELKVAGVPEQKCDGEFEALQWDGAAWKCATILATGPSGGLAKGFEARDSWGYVWDGLERQAATWAVADAACKAKGGRLPTITELFRVSGGGLSEVGNTYETNYLWARTPWSPTQHAIVRLTDGNTSYDTTTNVRAYRCVWPSNTLGYFAGNHCYGPPGAECWTTNDAGKRYNMDKFDRPPVSYVAATDECNFYHAHLPQTREYDENISFGTGLPNGSNQWLWSSDADRYDAVDVVRWTTAAAYVANGNSYSGKTATYRFRCIGVNYDAGTHPNPIANEFVASSTYLKGEALDKGSKKLYLASDECFANGGHVPTERDMMELVRAGLPEGTGNQLWTMDCSQYGQAQVIYWNGVDTKFTDYHSTYATWVGRDTDHSYRCTYYPIDADYAGPPNGKCVLGTDCFSTAKGGDVKAKKWADSFDRPQASYIDAIKDCYGQGGHVMTTQDFYELVREGLPSGSPNWLWTTDASDLSGNSVIIMKWTGTEKGFTGTYSTYATNSNKNPATTRPYRCVWTNELR